MLKSDAKGKNVESEKAELGEQILKLKEEINAKE